VVTPFSDVGGDRVKEYVEQTPSFLDLVVPLLNWFVDGRLGLPGIIHGVEIATDFFTGNFAPKASIQAARYSICAVYQLVFPLGPTVMNTLNRIVVVSI